MFQNADTVGPATAVLHPRSCHRRGVHVGRLTAHEHPAGQRHHNRAAAGYAAGRPDVLVARPRGGWRQRWRVFEACQFRGRGPGGPGDADGVDRPPDRSRRSRRSSRFGRAAKPGRTSASSIPLQVANSQAFSSIAATFVVDEAGAETTIAQNYSFLNDRTYYWRVQARDSGESRSVSPWSAVRTFETDVPAPTPPPPTAPPPTGGGNPIRLRIRASAVHPLRPRRSGYLNATGADSRSICPKVRQSPFSELARAI